MARTRARRSGKIGYAAPRSGKGYRLKLRCIALGLGAIGSLTCFSVSYLTTPRRVARLIAELCRPEPGMSCYDPCCGSGRLSRAAQSAASRSSGDRIRIFAQEINPIPVVAAAANRRMHDLEMTLKRGSSLRHPAFVDVNGALQRFDLAVANPMWNQRVSEAIYRRDRFGRFRYGWPSRDGDWVWMQHSLAHLKASGRMVVKLDHTATSRYDDLTEVNIRRHFVESDLIEAVILCPWEISRPRWLVRSGVIETPRAVLFVVNKAKRRSNEILFMDPRPLVGDYLAGNLTSTAVHNTMIDALYNWTTVPGVVEIVSNTDVAKSGFTLSPELHCAGTSVTAITSAARRRSACAKARHTARTVARTTTAANPDLRPVFPPAGRPGPLTDTANSH
jgi:type I restriction enzyme M protein